MEHYPLYLRLLISCYLALPLSIETRRKLRDFTFENFGGLFKLHPAYHKWRGHRNAFWVETQKLITEYGRACDPKAPKERLWYELALQKKPLAEEPTVDVIIPVYRGYDDTMRAIYNAVIAPNKTPTEIIVINDCSPDKALVRYLHRFASMGLFTLLENKKNLGFVQTVNRGLALHPQRDCVILNADCMVYGNYIDRMLEIAATRPKVATITPLTNNGELCSYPLQWTDNIWRNEMVDPKLDALCWEVNGTTSVEVPTGVGFCMYMSRESMNEVGTFNADAFGRGYGEENDFCLRATQAGYVHLVAGGIFARHVGGTSFQKEKGRRIRRAMKTLERLHPGYQKTIQQWKKDEPAKEMRIALDLARMKLVDKPSMLMVLHTWGGGTEKHVRDMAKWLEEEGVQVYYMMPVEGNCEVCQIGRFEQGKFQKIFAPNMRFHIESQLDELAAFLRARQIRHIHVNHLIGYDDAYYTGVPVLADRLGVAFDVTLHDYFSICPRTNLIDHTKIYCGEPDEATCNACISKNGSPVTRYKEEEPEIHAWRQMHLGLLEAAREVYVPNKDVGLRLSRYFPQVKFKSMPHPEAHLALPQRVEGPALLKPKVKKIALIGALHELKGALVLRDLAEDAAKRNLPLEYHIFGFYAVDELTLYEHGNVRETGQFKEKDLPMLVAEAQPDAALFLSVWPETFSYTLSQAYQFGLYPVAFDIGAPADRVRECGWGKLLPLELAKDAEAINDALMELEIPEKPAKLAVWEKENAYPNLIRDYYQLDSALFEADASSGDSIRRAS